MGTAIDSGSSEPDSGSVTVGPGAASVARIPVPGTKGLHIELAPRGYVPKSGSTSRIFIQDAQGKRVLRLDYGYNKTTGKLDYHWNQKGTFSEFEIADHSVAGAAGEALFKGARYFKVGGRVLLVVGVALDAYSIVVAKKRWRQVVKVAAGWGGAWAGCEVGGAGGAMIGSGAPGIGTVVVGFVGCIAGGTVGYLGASRAAEKGYDWVEETYFEPVRETAGQQ